MLTVYLALGSNLGDRVRNLASARDRIAVFVRLARASSLYETELVGGREQPWLAVQVLVGATELSPVDLLRKVKRIEIEMGRSEGIRFGPRPIDIDILFVDRLIALAPILTIPHPRLHLRASVLVPLAEIAPDLVHPRFRVTVRELLRQLDTPEQVRRLVP